MTRNSSAPPPPPGGPIYCAITIEFFQPWEHLDAIRRVKELGLGNMFMPSPTFHVGNLEEDRRRWKELYPELAAQVDATPRFEDRPAHGMAALFDMPLRFWEEQIALCRELGLLMFAAPWSPGMTPAQRQQLAELARGIVLSDMAMSEATSFLAHPHSLPQLAAVQRAAPGGGAADAPRFDSAAELDCQRMHDWYLSLHRPRVAEARRRAPLVSAIEATTQLRLALEAGCDVPILELVPSHPLEGLASTRGAAKAYRAPFWGIHAAMGYYRAPTDRWTPERLRIAYDLFYIAGASFFSEPNLALANWGSCSAFFTEPASPPIRLGEEERRGFDDPIVVRGREVLAEHYRFTHFHPRPARGPRVRLGFVQGHLDAWIGVPGQTHVWAVDDPAFAAGPAEATWRHFGRLYDAENWYTPPRKYYWQADPAKPLRHGTPPCGQLDIVPIEAPLDVLRTYRCLVFLGWNTMTAKQYDKLQAYVEGGGRLVMSVPHLSTSARRDAPLELFRGGDWRDLFGVRVRGGGADIDEVMWVEPSAHERYVLPLNTLYLEEASLAKLELQGARVLARPRQGDEPVLVEHRCGAGLTWLLATWDYPGQRLDAFVTDILRTIAEGEQDDISLEGEGVEYAIYDGEFPHANQEATGEPTRNSTTRQGRDSTSRRGLDAPSFPPHEPEPHSAGGEPFALVYLVNKSIYGQPHYPRLLVPGQRVAIRVDGREMRLAWVLGGGDLLVSPLSRFVTVVHAERLGGAPRGERPGSFWRLRLEAEPGEHRLQFAGIAATPAVTINGRSCQVETTIEGEHIVRTALANENELVVRW